LNAIVGELASAVLQLIAMQVASKKNFMLSGDQYKGMKTGSVKARKRSQFRCQEVVIRQRTRSARRNSVVDVPYAILLRRSLQ